jgi:hypothetical protein
MTEGSEFVGKDFDVLDELKVNKDGFNLATYKDKGDVPTREQAEKNYSINFLEADKKNQQNRGLLWKGRSQERAQLFQMISKLVANTKFKADWVGYIPNSKIAWVNATLKRPFDAAMEGKKLARKPVISLCDFNFIKNMWMNTEKLQDMLNFMRAMYNIDSSISRFTQGGPPTKGPPVQCLKNDAGIYDTGISLYNPGNIYGSEWYDNNPNFYGAPKQQESCQDCSCSGDDCFSKIEGTLGFIDDRIQEIAEEKDLMDETSILDDIGVDTKYKNLVQWMRKILVNKQIPMKKLKEISKAMAEISHLQRGNYIMSLLNPFTYKNARIPTDIPTPSATFSLKSNINLTSNALGNVAFVYNPIFLASNPASGSMNVNNDSSLTGVIANNNFVTVDTGQSLPARIYTRYRVVSAAIRVTFTSSLLTSTGFATVSVSYDDLNVAGAVGVVEPAAQAFGNFSLMENGNFRETKATRNGDEIQLIYLPLDTRYTDFTQLNTPIIGFNFTGYISGSAPSTTIARLDVVTNYEALVDNVYTDYLPTSSYTGGIEESKAMRNLVSTSQQVESLDPEKLRQAMSDFPSALTDDVDGVITVPLSSQEKLAGKIQVKKLQDAKNNLIGNSAKTLKGEQKQSFFEKVGEYAQQASDIVTTVAPIAAKFISLF